MFIFRNKIYLRICIPQLIKMLLINTLRHPLGGQVVDLWDTAGAAYGRNGSAYSAMLYTSEVSEGEGVCVCVWVYVCVCMYV